MVVFPFQATDHYHAPQPDRVPAIQLKNEIKARTIITGELTSPIIHSALRKYPLSAAGEFQRNEAVMLMIRRQRTAEEVDVDGCLPEKLRKMCRDKISVLHEDKNSVSFTTKTNLSVLKQNKHWSADGTFSRPRTKMFYPFFFELSF